MAKRVPVPFVAPLDSSGDATTYKSALDVAKNGYLDVSADGTATFKLRPVTSGSELDLSADIGNGGVAGLIAWPQVAGAKPTGTSDGANGWFLAYSENENGQATDFWTLNAPAETTSGFDDWYEAYYGDTGSASGGLQAPSVAFYYDRTYSDGDLGFVTTGENVYLIDWDGTTTPATFQTWQSVLTTGTLPTSVVAVAAFRGHIVFTDGDLLYWSDLNDYKSVPAINVAGADLMNDRIISLAVYRNELVVCGSRSIEFWQLTGGSGATAFAPTVSATLSMGIAPLSNLFVWKDSCYFVNNQFQVVRMNNRQLEVLSDPIANDISPSTFQVNQIYKVGCAYVGDTEFLFVSYTTTQDISDNGRTFVMSLASGTWSEWTKEQTQAGGPTGFPIPATSENTGMTLGVTEDDSTKVDRLFPPALWQPFSGATIDFELVTGFNDYGSVAHKRSLRLIFKLLAGNMTNITVEFRDEESDSWTTLSSNVSAIEHIGEFIALGRYRNRQYRITATPTSDLAIGQAEEHIEYQEF